MNKPKFPPSREWLLGFVEGYYSTFMGKDYLKSRMKKHNLSSRESLYKLYLKITEAK